MALSVACPGCQAVYPVSESLIGKTIRCKKCGETMPVSAPTKAAAPAAAEIIEDDAPPPRSKSSRHRDEDDDEIDRPAAKSPRRRDPEDDEEVPTPKSKRRAVADEDDEDEDDRPSRRGTKDAPKSKAPLLIGGLVAIVLLGGGIAAAVMMSGDGDKPDTNNPQPVAVVNPEPKPDTTPKPEPTAKPTVTPKPDTTPKMVAKVEPKDEPKAETKAEEAKPAPKLEDLKPTPTPTDNGFSRGSRGSSSSSSNLSAQEYFNGNISELTMETSKKASVLIRVETDTGGGEGSGWFGVAPGLVFTNSHVLNMKSPNSPEPRKLTFFLNAGTPNQREIPHAKLKILAVDRDIDLAVIQIVGETDLPTPLKIKHSAELKLGQTVFTVGYPTGSTLSTIAGSKKEPEVSVRKTSFIGTQTDDFGQLRVVKLESGITQGNSGGPVIDADGVVTAVVVAVTTQAAGIGQQIGLCIPTEYVEGLIAGRVASVEYGFPYKDKDKIRVPVTATVLNPMRKAIQVRARTWVGDATAKARTPGPAKPQPGNGDADAQDVELKYDEKTQKATGEVVYPVAPVGRTYWAQPYYTNAILTYAMPGLKIPVVGSPLDLIPANLTAAPKESARRIVTMSNSSSMTEDFEGEGQAKSEKTQIVRTLKVNEQVVKKDASDMRQLARLYFQFDSFNLSIEQNGIKMGEISKREQDEFNKYIKLAKAYGLLNRFGEMYDYKVELSGINDPIAMLIVTNLSKGALDAMQATSIEMPNMTKNPGETWKSSKDVRLNLVSRGPAGLIGQPAKPTVREYKYRDEVTYKYLGLSERDGRKEAVVEVEGKSVRGPGSKENVTGAVKGRVWVELDTGVVMKAEIEKDFEIDTSRDGQKKKLSSLNTFKLDRSAAQ